MKMIEISKHCSFLSKIISGYTMGIEWPHQFDWLNVASGIVKVDFDVIRYDENFGYCVPGDDWHGAREESLQEYITECTRFTYVWCALESLIDDIKIPPEPVKGKINKICQYMKDNLKVDDIIIPYEQLLGDLKNILISSDVNEPKILERFNGADHVSTHGTGLYVIYKLRNLFVHGDIGLPLPDEGNKATSKYPDVVYISSRIILLSLQMIWLAYYKNSDLRSRIHWNCYLEDEEDEEKEYEYCINEILKNFHLDNPYYSKIIKC